MKIIFALLLAHVLAFGLTVSAVAQEATRNDAIQDKAVVKDQIRQDNADAKQDVKIAAAVKTSADAANTAQDVATTSGNTAQNVILATNTASIKQNEAQDITDRQFMGVMAVAMFAVLVAVWWMQHKSSSGVRVAAEAARKAAEGALKSQNAINDAAALLVTRTELLEAHIKETTPRVVEAYEKNRRADDGK